MAHESSIRARPATHERQPLTERYTVTMSSLSQEQQRAVVMMRQQAQMQAQQEIMQVRTLGASAQSRAWPSLTPRWHLAPPPTPIPRFISHRNTAPPSPCCLSDDRVEVLQRLRQEPERGAVALAEVVPGDVPRQLHQGDEPRRRSDEEDVRIDVSGRSPDHGAARFNANGQRCWRSSADARRWRGAHACPVLGVSLHDLYCTWYDGAWQRA